MSGSRARPRAVLPVSSSSSSSDCAGGAHAGATLAADTGASAEKMDCDTSERINEARFWPLQKLDKQRTKETSAPGAHTGEHVLFCSTHVSPFCSSANLNPTESTQPCAAPPRFARPSPIVLSGVDTDVGEAALARFPEPGCESSPVSALSASASGACESRDRRRSTLPEGDCNFIHPEFGAMTSSRWPSTLPESVFTSATDDMDDCERRGLPSALGAEEVVVVEETEFDAAWLGSRFARREDDGRAREMDGVSGGLVVATASARTPPTKPLSTADDAGEAGVDVEGIFRPNSRRTMRSHLRLSSRSSDSCIARWERNSRHLDSFWAINCRRSAYLLQDVFLVAPCLNGREW
jgi:hypothetical protein